MQESVCASVFVDAHAQVSRRCVADKLDSHVAENILLGQLSAGDSPVFNLSRGCLAGQELKMSSHAGFPAPRAAWPDVGRDRSVSPPRGTSLVVKAGRPAGSASLHVDAFVWEIAGTLLAWTPLCIPELTTHAPPNKTSSTFPTLGSSGLDSLRFRTSLDLTALDPYGDQNLTHRE